MSESDLVFSACIFSWGSRGLENLVSCRDFLSYFEFLTSYLNGASSRMRVSPLTHTPAPTPPTPRPAFSSPWNCLDLKSISLPLCSLCLQMSPSKREGFNLRGNCCTSISPSSLHPSHGVPLLLSNSWPLFLSLFYIPQICKYSLLKKEGFTLAHGV